MTHVLTIQELQTKIPETLQLEGVNYPDMKILLTSIIKVIEQSGKFEFVQYISNKPSLFVVRDTVSSVIKTDVKNAVSAVENKSSELFKTAVKSATTYMHTTPSEESSNANVDTRPIVTPSVKLFDKTKLPWE